VPLPGQTVPADMRALPRGLLFIIGLMRVVVLKGGGDR